MRFVVQTNPKRAVQASPELTSRPSGDERFRGGPASERTPVQGGVAQATLWKAGCPSSRRDTRNKGLIVCEEVAVAD